MVKTVIGEESHLTSIEHRLNQSNISSQVGLVIGNLSSNLDRAFVFDLVPTPLNDAGEPASWILETKQDKKKGGSKSKSQSQSAVLEIDREWVAEHARQVSRMLVGGMKVVGVYIWVNETLFKNSTLVLCQTVKGVADAAPIRDIVWDERLLIHISYSPRRWTCKNCSLSSNITSSSLRPCDFKMGRVLSTLQKFKCVYNFDIRFPISRQSVSKNFAGIVRDIISSHAEELKKAKALIDGKFVNVDEQYTSDGVHEVEFLIPFTQQTSLQAYSEDEVVGILVFSGSICSYAYSNSKEPISQALADIKGDIISSLHSRLDVICDEADGQMDSVADSSGESVNDVSTQIPVPQLQLQLLRERCSLSFPRRVFVPWLAGTYICDYIQPSETLEWRKVNLTSCGGVDSRKTRVHAPIGYLADVLMVECYVSYVQGLMQNYYPRSHRKQPLYPYGIDVLKDHCVELMSMEAPTDTSMILEPEGETLTLSSNSFWETLTPSIPELKTSSSNDRSDDKGSVSVKHLEKSSNASIVAALLVLILSILVGFMLFVFRT